MSREPVVIVNDKVDNLAKIVDLQGKQIDVLIKAFREMNPYLQAPDVKEVLH